MVRGVNKVILIGNLGNDPDVRTTTSGKNVATISMVTNEMRRNAETGEYTEFAEWHRVVMWNKLADIARQYLHKGSQIYIEGKLRTRSYMDKDGQKRYTTEVVADDMQMLGSKPANQGARLESTGTRDPFAPQTPAYGGSTSAPVYGGNSYGNPQSAPKNVYNSQPQAPATPYAAPAPAQGQYGAPQAPQAPQNSYGQATTATPNPFMAQPQTNEPSEPLMTQLNDDIPF